jgi:ribosomal protein L5
VWPRWRSFEGFEWKGKPSFGFLSVGLYPEGEENPSFFQKLSGIHVSFQMQAKTPEEARLLLSGFQLPSFEKKDSE